MPSEIMIEPNHPVRISIFGNCTKPSASSFRSFRVLSRPWAQNRSIGYVHPHGWRHNVDEKLIPSAQDVVHPAAGADVGTRKSLNDSPARFSNHRSEVFGRRSQRVFLQKDACSRI